MTGPTPAQTAFLVALAIILLAVAAFGALVLAKARHTGGGLRGPVARLGRPSIARLEIHRWAFYAHRVSGVAIFGFLALHLVDVGLVAISTELYDEVHALYGTVALRIFEVGLLAAILFHAANGMRLLVIDLVEVGASASERMLWVAVVVTVVLTIPAGIVILAPVFA